MWPPLENPPLSWRMLLDSPYRHWSPFEQITKTAVCVMGTLLLCVYHTRPDRWKDGSRERIDECMHSGRAGERWRALGFFSLSLFSQCREVTSSSMIWRECHATLPLLSPWTQMKFYFCAVLWRENNSFPSWLMSGMWAFSTEGGSAKIRIPLYILSLICHMY